MDIFISSEKFRNTTNATFHASEIFPLFGNRPPEHILTYKVGTKIVPTSRSKNCCLSSYDAQEQQTGQLRKRRVEC